MPLRRRTLLVLLGSALMTAPAGCTLFDGDPAPPRASGPPPPPDPLLVLVEAERTTLALYDSVLTRYPQLAARLAAVRADHEAHLGAMRALLRNRSASPSPLEDPSPTPVVAPPTPAAAIGALRAAELAAAKRLSVACLTAPASRAALLGSIAGCESGHLLLVR